MSNLKVKVTRYKNMLCRERSYQSQNKKTDGIKVLEISTDNIN